MKVGDLVKHTLSRRTGMITMVYKSAPGVKKTVKVSWFDSKTSIIEPYYLVKISQ